MDAREVGRKRPSCAGKAAAATNRSQRDRDHRFGSSPYEAVHCYKVCEGWASGPRCDGQALSPPGPSPSPDDVGWCRTGHETQLGQCTQSPGLFLKLRARKSSSLLNLVNKQGEHQKPSPGRGRLSENGASGEEK